MTASLNAAQGQEVTYLLYYSNLGYPRSVIKLDHVIATNIDVSDFVTTSAHV